jgi:hypothetical protein
MAGQVSFEMARLLSVNVGLPRDIEWKVASDNEIFRVTTIRTAG